MEELCFSGLFGHVFLALDEKTGEKVAIKIQTNKEKSTRQQSRMLLENEAAILRSMVLGFLYI